MDFDIPSLIREVGPFFTIMLFFVWRDYRREERLENKVSALNEFIQNRLMAAIEKNNEILTKWNQ
jgi:hypothetical protein